MPSIERYMFRNYFAVNGHPDQVCPANERKQKIIEVFHRLKEALVRRQPQELIKIDSASISSKGLQKKDLKAFFVFADTYLPDFQVDQSELKELLNDINEVEMNLPSLVKSKKEQKTLQEIIHHTKNTVIMKTTPGTAALTEVSNRLKDMAEKLENQSKKLNEQYKKERRTQRILEVVGVSATCLGLSLTFLGVVFLPLFAFSVVALGGCAAIGLSVNHQTKADELEEQLEKVNEQLEELALLKGSLIDHSGLVEVERNMSAMTDEELLGSLRNVRLAAGDDPPSYDLPPAYHSLPGALPPAYEPPPSYDSLPPRYHP